MYGKINRGQVICPLYGGIVHFTEGRYRDDYFYVKIGIREAYFGDAIFT